MDENQNLKANGELTASEIKEALKTQGLSDQEVEERLMKWKVSTSGNYDPIRNVYLDVNVEADIDSSEFETDSFQLDNNHLPIDQFGAMAKRYANALSHGFKVSKDLIVATMLMGVAEAANRKLSVVHGNYTNFPCLWMCVVERSGGNKSEPMARVLKPLEAINRDLVNDYQRAFNSWKDGGEKGIQPPKTKIIISDSTPEVRNELLMHNGLLLNRDELLGFLKDINRYSVSGETELMLTIWSGGGFSVDRKTSGCFYVENPLLNICGGIQPSMLQEAFGGKGFESSGFLARWLFLWITDSKVPDSIVEETIDKNIENEWFSFIQDIWRMPQTEFRLNDEASNGYQFYMAKTASVMNSIDCEDSVRAMLAKLRIYLLRLVLIIHLLRNGKFAPQCIDAKTMNAAITTCNCFQYWNERAMAAIQDSGEQKRISNAALIRELAERFNITNQSEFARLLNRSQQYINKVLNQ